MRAAICAFAADLNAKGMNAADIAAEGREAVLELRDSGAPLAAELAEADPSLDQTVAWCLAFADGPKNPLRNEGTGGTRRGFAGPEVFRCIRSATPTVNQNQRKGTT
jgi:Asp-tRNA(Asn)/Glu-tRNA(Gln) amidotransferase A subunit family amidase